MKTLLYIVATLIYISSSAQSIQVFCAEEFIPIPYTHIVCFYPSFTDYTVIVSDKNGRSDLSEINTHSSELRIRISSIGYKTLDTTISQTNGNLKFFLLPLSEQLSEVVITAQYAPSSYEKSVHKVKIIGQEKIKSMGAQNLRDVLTNELNIRLTQDNILGASMSLQGISGQNIKILIDDVPVIGRLDGNIDISQINLNNVERIEIIEGPLSVNYGTDALAGTINIITKKTQKNNFSITSNNYYESNGHFNTVGNIGIKKSNHMITLSGGRHYFDGWRPSDPVFYYERYPVADSSRYKQWKPKQQLFGTLAYNYYWRNLSMGLTSDIFTEKVTNKGLPRSPFYETAFDDYYKTRRINNAINITGKLNEKYYLKFLSSYNLFQRIKNTYFKDLTTLEQQLTEQQGAQDTTVINYFISRAGLSSTSADKKINFEVGYEINHETGKGLRIKNTQQKISDYSLFSSIEYIPHPKVTIRPGARISYNTSYRAPITPSINVRWNIYNNDYGNNITFRISYARGFRAPSLKELYFYFVDINHNIAGNENLDAEYSHNLHFSTSYKQKIKLITFKTSTSFFFNHINNMISLALGENNEYSYFNVDIYQTLGFQLNEEFKFKQFNFQIGGAFIGRKNQLQAENFESIYLFSPEYTASMSYKWTRPKLAFNLFYKYTGKLPNFIQTVNQEYILAKVDDYNIADVSITKSFVRNILSITAGVKNLFDVTNISGNMTGGGAHSSSGNSIAIGTGRSYFLKLDLHFNSTN